MLYLLIFSILMLYPISMNAGKIFSTFISLASRICR